MFLWNRTDTPEFAAEMAAFRASFPDYAPGRFLETEALDELARTPRLVGSEPLALQDAEGGRADVEISAVVMKVGDTRGSVAFVDNAARRVYGERYFDGPWSQIEPLLERFAREVLTDVREEYRARSEAARAAGRTLPLAEPTLSGVGETILARTRAAQGKPE
jgi:spermidine synthase